MPSHLSTKEIKSSLGGENYQIRYHLIFPLNFTGSNFNIITPLNAVRHQGVEITPLHLHQN